MAIPISYNVRSIAARWKTTIVSILGIAGTVGVFVAMLAMARGFQATLIASGSASNSIIRRAGASFGNGQRRLPRPGTGHRGCAAGRP